MIPVRKGVRNLEAWTRILDGLAAETLFRDVEPLGPAAPRRADRTGRPLLDFSSNDYQGLASHPAVIGAAARAAETWGAGAGASRLLGGTLGLTEELERDLARWKGAEAALLFGSGTLANLGILKALTAVSGAEIFMDRLAHASLVDGALLSGARWHRFRHNDCDHLEGLLRKKQGPAIIVAESVYSMDGDLAPLADLRALAVRHDAVLVLDEAHAVGVFGPALEGAAHDASFAASPAVVRMGTLGKAVGNYGAYVAGSATLRRLLVNKARSFLFTTALPPSVLGGTRAAVELLRVNPGWGTELRSKTAELAARLRRDGWNCGTESAILPLPIGENGRALAVMAGLRRRGIYAAAVRPPTVPRGTARIRITLSRLHTAEDLARLETALQETREEIGPSS